MTKTIILSDLLREELSEDYDLNNLYISMNYNWICRKYKHCWSAKLSNRIRGDGCPYCSGRKLLAGFNDLLTVYPKLAELIVGHNPIAISSATDKKYRFTLNCSHEIIDSPKIIVKRNEWCYYCSGRKVLKGFNSVLDKEEQVLKYWDLELNTLGPDKIHHGSNKTLYWLCSANHKWKRTLRQQIKTNYCSFCTPYNGKKNLLSKTKYAKELDVIKNNSENIDTRLLTVGSHKYVNWLCIKKNHQYKTSVKNRIKTDGCTRCLSKKSSKLEKEIFNFIDKNLDKELISNFRIKSSTGFKEADIFIPELAIAFEVNGVYWHSDRHILNRYGVTALDYHTRKQNAFKDNNIKLYFIWEDDWICNKNKIKENIISTINGNSNIITFQKKSEPFGILIDN